MGATTMLALEHVSKAFQGQRALDDVDLDVRRGEVHALLGQNGSGKSTLLKVLAGVHRPDAGAARLDGQPLELGSAAAAHSAGARFVHQDLGLIGDLDVADNLALTDGYGGRRWLSTKRERALATAQLAAFDVDVPVDRPVRELSAAQRTMVAVVRALSAEGRRLLVLDEPTSALPAREVDHLFSIVRSLQDRGLTILYVTHRLDEVFAIADRVSVLRNGRRVATRRVADLDHHALVELIVGRAVDLSSGAAPSGDGAGVLAVEGLRGARCADVSFGVRAGEVLGLAGIVGSGVEDVLGLAFGAVPRAGGRVAMRGSSIRGRPGDAIDAGIGYLPADRGRLGALPGLVVRENLTLPALEGGRARWLSPARERNDARGWLRLVAIDDDDPERRFAELSGGNQQKVLLARWLRRRSDVLLLEEPTKGVDLGARASIYAQIRRAAHDGAGVVVASSDVDELCLLCHRVAVLRDGVVVAELHGEELSPDLILTHAMREPAAVSAPSEAR